jgi:hypothetical protein
VSHVKQVTESFRAIPRERRAQKLLRTALGLGILGLAVLAGMANWPWYAVLGIGGVGAHIASAELVEKAVRFAVAVLRDVLNAVRGKSGTS